jgi:hypothetical protein
VEAAHRNLSLRKSAAVPEANTTLELRGTGRTEAVCLPKPGPCRTAISLRDNSAVASINLPDGRWIVLAVRDGTPDITVVKQDQNWYRLSTGQTTLIVHRPTR